MTKRRSNPSKAMILGILAGLAIAPAWALNPQPEVPSKPGHRQDWRALNPQPEVPSKPSGAIAPKALNPQPEVPSKPAKGTHEKKKKSSKPPGAASGS